MAKLRLKDSRSLVDERPLPPNSPLTPKQHVVYRAKLTENAGGFFVEFEDVDPTNPVKGQPDDGPLDIYVFSNSVITIELIQDSADWEFSHDKGITLASIAPTPPDRDWNFNFTPLPRGLLAGDRCLSAQFDAIHNSAATAKHHEKYNLRFFIHRTPSGVTHKPPLDKFIDPDIKNPGDYGLLSKYRRLLKKNRKSPATKRAKKSR